jgi:hypothetical protein
MNIAELRALPSAEKLQIVEALWEDLTASGAEIRSPGWHETELRKTESRFAEGLEKTLDWSSAKQELKKRFE